MKKSIVYAVVLIAIASLVAILMRRGEPQDAMLPDSIYVRYTQHGGVWRVESVHNTYSHEVSIGNKLMQVDSRVPAGHVPIESALPPVTLMDFNKPKQNQ